MARKRTRQSKESPDSSDTAKRRQIEVEEALYRRCGIAAIALGMTTPEYVRNRLTIVVDEELPRILKELGVCNE